MDDWLTTADVAKILGITLSTLKSYRVRYGPGGKYAGHPFPPPDRALGRNLLWRAEREPELRAWAAARPGSGAGGGRPRKDAAGGADHRHRLP